MTRGVRGRQTLSCAMVSLTAGLGCGQSGAFDQEELGATALGATPEVTADRAASHLLPDRFSVGRPATDAELAALDIDVMPDGKGLPGGAGWVQEGEALYALSCLQCHGANLEGTPLGDKLMPPPDAADGFPDGDARVATHAIGNYWPYATTVFDYVRRAMPFDRPGSLTNDEVYALTAYLLWKNGVIEEDAVMDAETLPAVVMPARGNFVVDDRLESDRVR